MKYDQQPVNLESISGTSFAQKFQLTISDIPAGDAVTEWIVAASRLPGILTPDMVQNIAAGVFNPLTVLRNVRPSQTDNAYDALGALRVLSTVNRMVSAKPSTDKNKTILECNLAPVYQGDMPPATTNSPSYDTIYSASQRRIDGPWFVSVAAKTASGRTLFVRGGLTQAVGNEHLVGVVLSPSDEDIISQFGSMLLRWVESFKPVIDFRTAQVMGSEFAALRNVLYTDEEKQDDFPAVYICPRGFQAGENGVAAPDRRELIPSFTIRVFFYLDDAAKRTRVISASSAAIFDQLQATHYREGALPSGIQFSMALPGDVTIANSPDTWMQGAEIPWSCHIINVGAF